MSSTTSCSRLLYAALSAWLCLAQAHATNDTAALLQLSIEELMNESITSVAKREQRLADAPAAVYVLTAEAILRAGHTRIPEALRMVPGLSVAQLDSHDWVITSRGFAAEWAGKLLVLIDGRSVYNPFFSGVVWGIQDLMIEDLDRIEVIRGPGAALWGANAVNGVINIITKQAKDTEGLLAIVGNGTQQHNGALRYGGQLGTAYYRVYAKYDDVEEFARADGAGAQDAWHQWRAGFRTDWLSSGDNSFTVQADVYGGGFDIVRRLTSLTPPYMRSVTGKQQTSGGNLLFRWQAGLDKHSRWTLQTYYDRTESLDPRLGINRDTFDVEFQHQLTLTARQALVYGAGYRFTQADYQDTFFLSYRNDHDSGTLVTAFIQDEVVLRPDKLRLTLGAKFEHNEFTGLEIQPNARVLWTPDREQSVWGSISKAVRTPNFENSGLRINYAAFDPDGLGPTAPRVLSILPNDKLKSEKVVAYELGYRAQSSRDVYLDIAGFFNVYDNLMVEADSGAAFEMTPPPSHLAIASQTANAMHGETYGIEFAPSWQVADWWKLSAGYTWLQMKLHSDAANGAGEEQEGDSPRHQWHLRSFLNGPHDFAFDTALYYVDRLPNQGVPSYVRLDVRLGWNPTRNLDLSLAAANLLDRRHPEFLSFNDAPLQQQRSFHGKLSWRF